MISNRTHAARSFDFEITRMISDQIALHSVQLPLLSIQKVLPDRVGIYDDGGMLCLGCKFFVWISWGAYPCSRPFVQLWGIFLEDKRTSQCQQWYKNSRTESQTFAKLKEQALDSFE